MRINNDPARPSEVMEVHPGWSSNEHEYLFDLVKRKLKEVEMNLTPKNFDPIADSMENVCSSKMIQEGDEMVATRFKHYIFSAAAPPDFPGHTDTSLKERHR
ncbi:hypothetical protein BDZ45DRAFT_268471 [Acephala macrosclerotiorum]|nr:hypothetical protein BDZ45DRAFT_268471 [Acephala macrosclerotiorum]